MVAARFARCATLVLACGFVTSSKAPAQIPASSGGIGTPGYVEGPVRYSVTRAQRLAEKKLQTIECQRLFTEFRDTAGQSLDLVLSSVEETPEQHLARMSFLDGSRTPTCRRDGVLAFTTTGGMTVFICQSFRRLSSVETAANILIHEELHSLGSGEAPMAGFLTAEQITSRVEGRCGR